MHVPAGQGSEDANDAEMSSRVAPDLARFGEKDPKMGAREPPPVPRRLKHRHAGPPDHRSTRRATSARKVHPGGRARHLQVREFRWRGLRSAFVALLVLPGIFGILALPNQGVPPAAAGGSGIPKTTGAQSLVAADWNRPALDRDIYSATSVAELAEIRAAAAAAAAALLAEAEAKAEAEAEAEASTTLEEEKKSDKIVDSAEARPSSSRSYVNRNDSELAAFLVGRSDVWVRPVDAPVSSPYGPREVICNPVGCSSDFHEGVDFGAGCGTPVKAVSAGRVVFVGSAGSYGNRVVIDHGGGVESIYGHLRDESYLVAVGDLIETGTVVAEVGATGVVTGCHLDLKIRVNGSYTSPVPYLTGRGVSF